MTVLVFVVLTATLYYLLFRFAMSRTRERPVEPAEPTSAPRAEPGRTVEEPGWTALDDHQLDRLLKDSSP